MPTKLPPRRRPAREAKPTDGDTLVPALIAGTLLVATIALYFEKTTPIHYYQPAQDYSLAAFAADSQRPR
jgi:hypothetical protein